MPSKEKDSEKVPVLKGPAAEKRILEYIKEMNRPFGAADIFANLKGAVPKASVQKILVTLAEKGSITQKAYGKILVFVAKQADLSDMSPDDLEMLEADEKKLTEQHRCNNATVKNYTQELTLLRNTPTNEELEEKLRDANQMILDLQSKLDPLRSGKTLITAEELASIDAEWHKWRTQWVERRKIFVSLYNIVTDAMVPEERLEMDENLGIEYDTPEHMALESSPLCKVIVPRRH